jgi:hypothetical protein
MSRLCFLGSSQDQTPWTSCITARDGRRDGAERHCLTYSFFTCCPNGFELQADGTDPQLACILSFFDGPVWVEDRVSGHDGADDITNRS